MQNPVPAEFWRSIPPIRDVFKPDAKAEVHIPNVATEDRRYYVPFTDTVSSRPLWISPSENRWADVLRADGPGLVNRHYHPHEVFAYTISGRWGYLEHDWVASAGDFVYETPGEGHTLVAHHSPEPMRVFFIVKGPLIWLDEQGSSTGHFDVHDYIALCRAHYDKVGIGAAHDRWFSAHGAAYMIVLGLLTLTLAVAVFARGGLWGALSARTDLRLFPVQRRVRPGARPPAVPEK